MPPGLHELDNLQDSSELGDIMKKQTEDDHMEISRPVYTTREYREEFYRPPEDNSTIVDKIKGSISKCTDCSPKRRKDCCFSFFPFIKIMRKYKIREDLPNDIIAGLTVGIMQLPQGMAYALLAEMPPVVGLYMSFFPVLMYFFFGTSKQVSMGTVAVVSLMTGTVVGGMWDTYGPGIMAASSGAPVGTTDASIGVVDVVGFNGTVANSSLYNTTNLFGDDVKSKSISPQEFKFKVAIASSVCVMAGVAQVLMSFGRLGVVTTYMGEPLISGFTTGAAVHVFTSQVKNVFGLKIPRFGNLFQIMRTYGAILGNITKTNPATLIMSIICIIILYLVKVQVNTRYKAKLRFPIPIELAVVIVGTVASYLGTFNESWSIKVVGEVPAGLPIPMFPPMLHAGSYIMDSVVIAVIAFAQSISLASIMAKRHQYEIDSNKELFAYGMGNLFGSLFSCYPFAASVSRSSVQDAAGGRTQISSLFSASLVLIVIIVLGPLFETLPICVLSAIIMVALRSMLLQVFDFKKFANTSKYDGAIWMVTFVAVVILHADLGLLAGIIFSVFTVVIRSQKTQAKVTAEVSGVGTFEEVKSYKSATPVPSVKVVFLDAPIYFANGEIFVKQVYEVTGIKPEKFRKLIIKMGKSYNVDINEDGDAFHDFEVDLPNGDTGNLRDKLAIKYIILDLSAVSFTDTVGIKCLRVIIEEFREVNITVYLTNVREDVWRAFEATEFLDKYGDRMFLTVNDAMIAATSRKNKIYKGDGEDEKLLDSQA